MKKNAVNDIFADDYKRKTKIISYICIIAVFVILFISFSCTYYLKSKKDYINYTESSDVNYKVYLKQNEFFDKNYAEEEKQYIASLIDYINTTFKYNIQVEKKNVDFNYSYYIDAEVNVKERNGTRSLYNFKETILDTKNGSSHGSSKIGITESVSVDYNHYNEIIKKFISTYKLDDIVSTLTINMHVSTASTCDDFDSDNNTESVVSLVIPLTTKTMAIDITNDLADNEYKFVVCNKPAVVVVYLILSLVFLGITVFLCVKLSEYIAKTRSINALYDRELKKILSNYHSYIQKVQNKIDLKKGLGLDNFKECQIFKLETFTDMLEIRDNINAPILMACDENNTSTYFLILDVSNKAIYVYSIRIKDIKRKIKKQNSELEENN